MWLRCAPLVVSLSILGSSLALAQEDDPEAGETQSEAAAPPRQQAPSTWGGSASSEWGEGANTGESAKPRAASSSGDSDHENVVGKISFGILGTSEVPVGTLPGGTRVSDSFVTAPVLGSRYWLSERFGIEAGLGFMARGGSVDDSLGNKGDLKSRAFALHAGVPIALAWGEHYNLLAIPYAGLGFSKARDSRGNAASADDIFADGFLFEVGLKAGVEIQLGAIGLEGFALQLTGGLRLRVEKRSSDLPIIDTDPNTPESYKQDSSETVFATLPGGNLGSALSGALAAIYYF